MELSKQSMSTSTSTLSLYHATTHAQIVDNHQSSLDSDQSMHNLDNIPQIRSLPSQVQIHPITPDTVQSYRGLITLLLPIRYPDKFYKEAVANTSGSTLARVALWDDTPTSSTSLSRKLASSRVVGGIQCRLEDVPSGPPGEFQLYIQTIALLSPFRQLGIATCLLDSIITSIIEHCDRTTNIYAHVWETNFEALEWYERRGFAVEDDVVEDYYQRLKPSGARVVRRRIGIEHYLAVKGRRKTTTAQQVI
jgi:ribosomal protein S18 acetylase RimI-like enzyme